MKETLHDNLNAIVGQHLRRSSILTENIKRNLNSDLSTYFHNKGYLDVKVDIIEEALPKQDNAVNIIFNIDRKRRIRISDIIINKNARTGKKKIDRKLKDKNLRRKMKNIKKKGELFVKSKFLASDYKKDKKTLIAFYNSLGLRDAQVIYDTTYRNEKGDMVIQMDIHEGNQYYFRNISWEGNTIYPDVTLATVLGIQKGDVYNPGLLEKQLRFSEDSRDVSSLYMDEGYLFFNIEPVQVAISGDSVDLEMRIYEGPQATIDTVTIVGNDRTHEHVLRRTLRTHPGEKISRSNIIRSQREIINLGYFDPENLDINTPVNQQRGSVDVEYEVSERPSDKFELSAGYNGSSKLLGTMGATFNNFSLRRTFEKGAWRPVPMGDGQKLSLRGQSNGSFFRSVNFSFTEPWFGGKKPNSLSLGGSFTEQALGGPNKDAAFYSQLRTLSGFVGIGKRLKKPDDFFFLNANVNVQNLKLSQNVINPNLPGTFSSGGNAIFTGSFNNIYLGLTIGRSSINDPLFPTRGSRVSLSTQFTPPYSLFKQNNLWKLSEEDKADVIENENARRADYELGPLEKNEINAVLFNAEASKRFNLLEYHKWRFDAEWFNPIGGKLVLRSAIKMGFIGYYIKSVGAPPFERFQLGGDGITNNTSSIQGIDLIRLRGYEDTDISDHNENGRIDNNENEQAVIFNKFEFELRYPISTNPNSTIYALGFMEGGNSWNSFGDYKPFDLRRSVGLGVRVNLPVFGLIGFDYGWGFDKDNLDMRNASPSKYAKIGLIIGFEPD